ncbi:hypothetical protein SAMN02745166_01908 [Prosthecobacter debontii]|uniref:Uncharacterized protein n=1 Tax=Prosthecobacter debontii TaxID=48467 RepID=A0A1T4XTL0_9BACT|nr:hypothetical protein SAMN02745166_01908 [Prosthecobacter debontii]
MDLETNVLKAFQCGSWLAQNGACVNDADQVLQVIAGALRMPENLSFRIREISSEKSNCILRDWSFLLVRLGGKDCPG